MGFNTTVMICNDAWSAVLADPKGFVDKIHEGMGRVTINKPFDFGLGNHVNGFQVVANQHADVTTLVAIGGNHASILGFTRFINHHEEEGQVFLLKMLAEKLGYRVSKKPRKR